MITVVHLPPEEGPKQLTARYAAHSLRDHFLAFLNANNEGSFGHAEVAMIDEVTIVDMVLALARNTRLPLRFVKMWAKRMKRNSDGAVKHGGALDLIARVFGYQNWNDALHHGIDHDGHLVNRRNTRSLNLKLFAAPA